MRPNWRLLRFPSVPGNCRSDRAGTFTDYPFAQTGIPASRPNRSTEAERSRHPCAHARPHALLFHDVRPVPRECRRAPAHQRRYRRQYLPRWEPPLLEIRRSRRLVPVRLRGQSCIVNCGRPFFDIFVDEAGYPHVVDRNF